ncbi:ABC transporter permease [Hoeflea sp.]|uniref:ABC transporter permease n=1 Tax=Hoeflea sp. TaxID=1940281 RepID=UPI003B51D603
MSRPSNQISQRKLAIEDITASFLNYRFWMTLAWVDIVQRYRGSMLGPFWLTISTAVFLFGLGPLYATLFDLELEGYLPYLAAGIITWNFITTSVNESCSTYITAGHVMRQMRLPVFVHVLHLMARQVIIFAHSIPLYFLVHILLGRPFTWGMLWAVPGFLLLCGILTCVSMLLAVISLRYRDFIQIVQSVTQIAFFVTPIFWQVDDRPMLRMVADLNPIAAAIAIVRNPLLGTPVSTYHLVWAISGFVVLAVLAFVIFVRYRRRIIYWV